MTFSTQIWEPKRIAAVYNDQPEPPKYWLPLHFLSEHRSHDELIHFANIPRATNELAPFVAPLANGVPIYERRRRVSTFKPAYLKPSDPVNYQYATERNAGLDDATVMQRYEAAKADILSVHRTAIERRWEWLAAKAIIDGKVTIEGENYPAVEIDFGRDPSLTVALGEGTRWGDAGVSILGDLRSWSQLMSETPGGAAPSRLTVGTDAWATMLDDEAVQAQLARKLGAEPAITAIGPDARWVGNLWGTLEVWAYSDHYAAGGVVTPMLSPKDIVLSGPNVQGVRCFGAIVDVHAKFEPLAIFSRNYRKTGDVAFEQIVTQSAPLMVPVNPNSTLKATVVA